MIFIKTVNENITNLISLKIEKTTKYKNEILKAMNILLNGNYIKYDIENAIEINNKIELSDKAFQEILGHVNEKSNIRKLNGVYYTPNDVSKYIICNSFINKFYDNNEKMHNFDDGIKLLNKVDNIEKIVFNTDVIDPTCGSGEFLVNVFEIKYILLKNKKMDKDKNILNICKTIYGNDIDEESTDISKIRMFFYVVNFLEEKESIIELAKILNKQFYNIDFICKSNEIKKKFDIVIGNPPYVEYGKYKDKEMLKNKFGNVYADVIKNSINVLAKDGVLGFIIPISYVSTARMKDIREYVENNTNKQFVLSFADRPDCLFNGVHQKLNIIICKQGNEDHIKFTSNYKHWYKDERKELLNGREVISNTNKFEQFIPKLGNKIEKSIFEKIYTDESNNIYDIQAVGEKIYLNMRACFWIKAFSFNPGSKEYKEFMFNENDYAFIHCLLNSSLFWLYWTIVSDCWHITTKELKHIKVINNVKKSSKYIELYKELEKKLEKTKKYVGTKQIEYEYKHRLCKDVIDKIDEQLANDYKLSGKELEYVKEFAEIYRLGGNND